MCFREPMGVKHAVRRVPVVAERIGVRSEKVAKRAPDLRLVTREEIEESRSATHRAVRHPVR
jgi:hypothetical protein